MKVLAFALALWAGTAEAACRQALALALDVSGSVDRREYQLQRDGLATALGAPDVRAALLAEGSAPVRLMVYEWSGPEHKRIIVPWTDISDDAALDAVIGRIVQTPPVARSPTTAIGSALLFGFAQLEGESDCWKQTLDVSGDGQANTGPLPQNVPLPRGIPDVVVNGLVIGSDDGSGGNDTDTTVRALSSYFTTYVLRGTGAFVETARGFDDFAAAMERKLLRELQSLALAGADQ